MRLQNFLLILCLPNSKLSSYLNDAGPWAMNGYKQVDLEKIMEMIGREQNIVIKPDNDNLNNL